MAKWFGPRPIRQPIAAGWPLTIDRHGSCGCCKCGGFYSAVNVADNDRLFTNYPAFRNGLRLKMVIAGVPDAFAIDFASVWYTEASGMSGYNGTWYFDISRTQYGCIWQADDLHSFDVSYRAYDPGWPYDVNYTQRMRLGGYGLRTSGNPFTSIQSFFDQFSPDYDSIEAAEPLSAKHPMIAIDMEPYDSQYAFALDGFYDMGELRTVERSAVGWDSTRLTAVISGNLRFRQTIQVLQVAEDFDNPNWTGVGTFWDTATSAFKTAGTFTAEIERL